MKVFSNRFATLNTFSIRQMACEFTLAVPFTTDRESGLAPGGGTGYSSVYEGRLPVHSSDNGYTTHLFTMDAQTGAYTFGYDTGIAFIAYSIYGFTCEVANMMIEMFSLIRGR